MSDSIAGLVDHIKSLAAQAGAAQEQTMTDANTSAPGAAPAAAGPLDLIKGLLAKVPAPDLQKALDDVLAGASKVTGVKPAQATAAIAGADRFITVATTLLPVAATFDPDPTSKAIALALVPILNALHAFNADIAAGNDPTQSVSAVLGSLRGLKAAATG